MSRQIIKKPNGKYAIYSSIVDDIIYDDITKEEYIKIVTKENMEDELRILEIVFKAVDSGRPEKIYHQFALSYNEAKGHR